MRRDRSTGVQLKISLQGHIFRVCTRSLNVKTDA